MKTRNSLVSNSSSASFIVIWRSLSSEIDSKTKAVDALTKWSSHFTGDALLRLHSKTEELKPDVYRTQFFTSMMNSMSDFGEDAAFFILSLIDDKQFEIITRDVEGD